MALTTHPHLAPKLKKEYNYTSSPPRCLVACSRVNFTFTFTFNWRFFTNRGTVKVLAHQTCVCVCVYVYVYVYVYDTHTHTYTHVYRVSQEECARLREGIPYVKVYRYNPKHVCPKLNGYGDNGQRKVWSSGGSTHCTCQLTILSITVLECGVI